MITNEEEDDMEEKSVDDVINEEIILMIKQNTKKWHISHLNHVDKLLQNNKNENLKYVPCGLYRWRPELWRAPHWLWYRDQLTKEELLEIFNAR